jgi:GDP/UDP-N,N'-diacetylbacillosamine 2-epimerase (hydrolysing)
MTRRVTYISGTRADFGLMRSTLELIASHEGLELSIIATGMHLDPAYGNTVSEIEAAGLRLQARVEVEPGSPSGARMSRNIGQMIVGMTEAMERSRPDIILVLGDRGEMLAAAIAAVHLEIPLAHIHGGERSGTVDELVRHAISKLAHLHFVATEESRERLVRMGEMEGNIVVTGAPGLDGLAELPQADVSGLLVAHGLDSSRPFALLLYHPVPQEIDAVEQTMSAIVDILQQEEIQILALRPNSDAGGAKVLASLEAANQRGNLSLVTHLQRPDFVTLLNAASLLVGNSSSGIIEAATFGTPVVNIGTRQSMRQRNANIIDTSVAPQAITEAIRKACSMDRRSPHNVYGDGRAGQRIAHLLATRKLGADLLAKTNAY